MRRGSFIFSFVAVLATGLFCACSQGALRYEYRDGGDSGAPCEGGCDDDEVCRDGRCVSAEAACRSVTCPTGTHCEGGACVEDDPCDGIECPNPGEACQQGQCVAGAADEDEDGFAARDDCNDSVAEVHPGAQELCNGVDDDCDSETFDGSDQCDGLCCGASPTCRECCTADQCGAGDWLCTDYQCACDGLVCGSGCYAGGECCDDSNCASGYSCTGNRCVCSGVVCSGTCHQDGECCVGSDCGTGLWICTNQRCQCDETITRN